ncbi:uncharacterized protein LOC120635687 isoform X4 [Pararge aegeria]|uniref:uncharacterized protein LOC120635687 isoform X4 n=1 Tax=Pararge aegeria TaxID=116150 RepID=UPI0019D27C25|nr:uncharacterized protein LOC120635687 isoform X4 [Pararge aegeria]
MMSRGRFNQSHGWDSMRDDYDNTYDAQYPDDDINSGGVQLDHCKLYVKNITKAINEEGLRTAFAAYGNIQKVYFSKDPHKRFALITYETPSEAKLAMMKLNKTEPLRFSICLAHKKNDAPQSQQKERRYNNYGQDSGSYSHRNDNGSVSSRDRHSMKHGDITNDGINDHGSIHDDNVGFEQGLDPELEIEYEQLQLDYLKLQEEQIQCKQRMLILNRIGKKPSAQKFANRCILPDGRVVVRNFNDRSADQPDSIFNSAAGDSRAGSRLCLWCGSAADAYCARCGVAPYCGAQCQQRDWVHRHHSVCHNLARNKQVTEVDKEIKAAESTAPAPLRRPHSPVASNSKSDENNDRSRKNFMPAGQTRFQQGNRNQNHQNTKNSSNRGGANTGPRNTNTRRPMRQNDADEGEQDSWEPRAPPKSDSVPHSVPKAVVTNVASTPVAIPAPSKPYQPVNKEPELPKIKTVPEVKKVLPLVTVSDTTPTRKIVPKNYLIGTLAIGDTGLLSVDVKASDCRSKASGYVCLSLHEKCEQDYQMLCADYSVESETAADYKPNPGELFSYCNPEDGAYYRARLLNATSAALIDSSKIVNISPTDKLKIITPKYAELVEFSCVLDAPNVKIGDNVRITLKAKTPEGYKVQIENAETGASVGEGEVCRWMPLVEYPVPKPLPTAPAPAVEVPRPNLKNNSTVLLVEASALDRALVRPADTESMRKFDTVLQDVLQFGMNASPIKEPPQKGQVVIGKFSDGLCYRALCIRTSVKMNKYKLEYIEFGNIEINTLETIYACPQELDLNTKPTVVSVAKIQTNAMALTPAAEGYIEILRDTNAELILTLPDGSASAPSGAEVKLSIAKNKESVNKKIELMCTPDWKKIEENGGDVVDTKPLMLSDLEYLELPAGGGEFEILDVSMISQGALCGCQKIPGRPGADATLAAMTKQIEAYCNSELGKKPYLPKLEELCIAQFPPYPQWFRAVLCEQLGGPGGSEVRLCYIDYGNLETVPVTVIRKMLPEFVNGHPALASQLEIRGWPESPTNEMLVRAAQYMKIDEEGRGYLTVTRCEKIDAGLYKVDAPDLLKAMGAL